MKSILAFILLLAAGCHSGTNPPSPDPNPPLTTVPCIDTLGAAKYPHLLSLIPLNYSIGGFAQTFGDFMPVAIQELNRGRLKVRVNLLWSSSHTYGDADLPKLKSESARYQPLCVRFPGRVELAPFTEHNVSSPDKYLNAAQNAAPNCRIVNSMLNGGATWNPSFKNEVHGQAAKPNAPAAVQYNYSYDGEDSFGGDVKGRLLAHGAASMFCVWTPNLNGKKSVSDSTPVPERTAWPTETTIKKLVNMLK